MSPGFVFKISDEDENAFAMTPLNAICYFFIVTKAETCFNHLENKLIIELQFGSNVTSSSSFFFFLGIQSGGDISGLVFASDVTTAGMSDQLK